MEQRAKYAAEPNKFLESEVDLDEAVRAFQVRSSLMYEWMRVPCVQLLCSVRFKYNVKAWKSTTKGCI